MSKAGYVRSKVVALAVALVVVLATAQAGTAQTSAVSGEATALRATMLGTTTALASTGSLTDATDARAASELTGAISVIGGAEVLHAATIGSDAVRSEASLGNLALTVAGVGISADFVMSRAFATVGGTPAGRSSVEGLVVNGYPFFASGTENETLFVSGIKLVLNEVVRSATGITVSALHITSLDGLVDVVVTSATAGIH